MAVATREGATAIVVFGGRAHTKALRHEGERTLNFEGLRLKLVERFGVEKWGTTNSTKGWGLIRGLG
jgi:hypothetical protein